MRTDTGQTYHLSDYTPYPFEVEKVDLKITLRPKHTLVASEMTLTAQDETSKLVLDGENLSLQSIELDGEKLAEQYYELSDTALTLSDVPRGRSFTLRIVVEIDPEANTQLMGLYRSGGNYCTQCEAEGFRRITFYPDRPDVMSIFTTRIEGDVKTEPVLLGNGNLVETGELDRQMHYAVWHDPHPKPAYLFACVAGDLGQISDRFVTMSGRDVALKIYVEHGKEDQAEYAMDALKRSMRWDEEKWGREYDLDIFQIVAVSDFNMGAMENKGLNIFNDRLVLASPDTATDANYNAIEAVIAHEYFHNWTGNRITCRDWFQLCLKEGLTVYRDSEFTADMRSRPVKRIEDVNLLRAAQFPEDGGPLAHPVRPASYSEINNFYTATVYEKGSEVVRMLHTLLGDEVFAKGAELYFSRHDGEATTIEAWLKCFEDVSGKDLTQFARWYSQAGTPVISVVENYEAGTYRLDLSQTLPDTPDGVIKKAMVIPLRYGLLGRNGAEIESGLILLDEMTKSVEFTEFDQRPVLSMLREFSAPVKLDFNQSAEDRILLSAHDSDPFSRWQALQDTAMSALKAAIIDGSDPAEIITRPNGLGEAIGRILKDDALDAAFRALCLQLPDAGRLAQELGQDVDPDQLHDATESQVDALANLLEEAILKIHAKIMPSGTYDPGAADAGRRQLANACLTLMLRTKNPDHFAKAQAQFDNADNMTNRLAALTALVMHGTPSDAQPYLDAFEKRYAGKPLTMDFWLGLQARKPGSETLETVQALMEHPAFSYDVPNRIYALIRTFAMANLTGFNREDGAGYRFVVDCVIRLNATNPQVASRVLTAFRSWKMLEPKRAALARAELQRLKATPNLSTDVADIVSRTLG